MTKFVMLVLALNISQVAMAASDLYVDQALQKTNVAKQELQNLENLVPGPVRNLLKVSLASVAMQLNGIQSDLIMSKDPSAPGAQVNRGFVCSTEDTFRGGVIYTGRGPTETEARAAALAACVKAKSDFWCKGPITCEAILN